MNRIVFEAISDIGCKRNNNEDMALAGGRFIRDDSSSGELTSANDTHAVFAVADGMGGHRKGEFASGTIKEFLERDCILIEKTAKEAAGEYADCMLLSVTKDVPFHYLVLLKDLEIGEKKFMSMRRYFYFLLAQKKKII